MKVRINEKCQISFTKGKEAFVAYIGDEGVSVYLHNDEVFDDCIPLKYGEFDKI